MTTEDNGQHDAPTHEDNSKLDRPESEKSDVPDIKGIEGEAPLPDDQPKREDEDLSALLQNPNANQKSK